MLQTDGSKDVAENKKHSLEERERECNKKSTFKSLNNYAS
jgi:hypothetical protein